MAFIRVKDPIGIDRVTCLAQRIWPEHYTPIIGKAQVDYMLETIQSQAAITQEIKRGCEYYLVQQDETDAGYFAIEPKHEENHLFLSKLYIHPDFRGLGLAKASLHFIEKRAKALNVGSLYLTVNKQNHQAIGFYVNMCFVKVSSFQKEIGNGFVMDDYGMEKRL